MASSASLIIVPLFLAALRLRLRRKKIEAQFPPLGDFITVNGTQVHYKTSGSGPHIVLIHGASGNLREWEFGLRSALEKSFTVTAFDRAGIGYSGSIANGDHLAAQAAHLQAAAQALGISTPVLIGHSYGGSVALAWALQNPPKAMLLLAAPSLPWPGKLDPWYRLTNSTLGGALAVPLAAALVPLFYVKRATAAVFAPQPVPAAYQAEFGAALTLRSRNLASNAGQVNALKGDLIAQMPGYSALDLPIELIHGESDTIVPLSIHSAPLSKILPNARLTVLANTGHMPHHADPAAVLAAMARLSPPLP